jgi:hypothetical protein
MLSSIIGFAKLSITVGATLFQSSPVGAALADAFDAAGDSGHEQANDCPQATEYWSPASVNDIAAHGQQHNRTIPTQIEVKVRQIGRGLEVSVCKFENGRAAKFINNVAFHISDSTSRHHNAGVMAPELPTEGKHCSAWIGLFNDTNYAPGEQFSGTWQLISPAASVTDWPSSGCAIVGNPGGTCWSGITPTMTRTCK